MKIRLPISHRCARAAASAALLAAFAGTAPAAAAGEAGSTSGEAQSPLLAPTAPHAARAGRCRASIEVSSQLLLVNEAVSVSGTVECAEGSEAGGQTVTLLAHSPQGAPGFAPVASATSEPDGSYRIQSPALQENTILFVRLARGHSARCHVRVLPALTLVAPVSGARLQQGNRADGEVATNTVTFTGTVTPARSALVVLQGELPAGSGRWRRIAVTHADESGRYAITRTFKRPGTVTVRVLVRGRGVNAIAASAPLTYTIAPRQLTPRGAHTHAARAQRT